MPDQLLRRVKVVAAERKTTFRAMVVDALEKALQEPFAPFTLRDASVGSLPAGEATVDSTAINRAIDTQREDRFTP